MRRALRVVVLMPVLLLPSCSDGGLPADLPLVVTEKGPQGTVQVTVDPEGTIFTSRRGQTTRKEVSDEEITELRRLMSDADLDDLDGTSTADPRYIIVAGDVEIFLGPNVPRRLAPLLDWIEEHRE